MTYSTSPRRLICQRQENGIAAIDIDTHQQATVLDFCESGRFVCDLIGLDNSLAAKYSAGHAIAVGMSFEKWAAWLALYQIGDGSYVWLSLCKAGEKEDCISALCLTSGREAIAPVDEKPYMAGDCIGFDALRFEDDFGIVCRMSFENWAAWLEQFEVCDLDYETAEMLCN